MNKKTGTCDGILLTIRIMDICNLAQVSLTRIIIMDVLFRKIFNASGQISHV